MPLLHKLYVAPAVHQKGSSWPGGMLLRGELYLFARFARFLFIALQACISRTCKLRLEFFNSTFRVDEFLLSRIERVAGTADINLQFFPCASGLKFIATTAFDGGLEIFWVDIFFHRFARSDKEESCRLGRANCLSHFRALI